MSYRLENSHLLKNILNASFLKGWSNKNFNTKLDAEYKESSLELYVTSDCGQNCSYCYLQQYKDRIYPSAIRNRSTILQNLRIIMNSVIHDWPNLKKIDIFSGELLGTQFGYEILDVILEAKRNGANFLNLVIPSNFSFITSIEDTKRIQWYIDEFAKIGTAMRLSASLDGIVIDEICRSFNDKSLNALRDQNFYDRAFDFAKKNTLCFHPMLSAPMMKYWIENVDWFFQQCKKFDMNFLERIMMLEVRNADWTEESIENYKKFLWHYNEDLVINNLFNGDDEKYGSMIFGYDIPGFKRPSGYHNHMMPHHNKTISCSVCTQLTVRLGDLAICPCHRTAYDELIYGKFVVENDRIVDIDGYNPTLAAKILLMNQRTCYHGCDVCWNKEFCIYGCFGSQYENGQEIFMPIPNVCNMLQQKTKTLFDICEKHHSLDYAKNSNFEISKTIIKQYEDLSKNLHSLQGE